MARFRVTNRESKRPGDVLVYEGDDVDAADRLRPPPDEPPTPRLIHLAPGESRLVYVTQRGYLMSLGFECRIEVVPKHRPKTFEKQMRKEAPRRSSRAARAP